MALNIPNVAPPEVESLYSQALRKANSLQYEQLQKRMQELQNQYYGPRQQAEIAHQNLVNQYYGPDMESLMGQRRAQTNEINSLLPGRVTELNQKNQMYIPDMQSQVALRNAQTGNYPYINRLTAAQAAEKEAEIPYIPDKYSIQQTNSITRQRELSNSINNSFRAWIQTPEGQQIVKNRPDIARSILRTMENQAGVADGNAMNNSPMQKESDSQQRNYVERPAQQYIMNKPLPVNASEDQLIKDIQRGAADAYDKANLPADTKKRLYAGERFKSSVPSVIDNFKLASIYFSPSGQAKLKKDEAKAFKDKRVPAELQAYRKFEQGLEQLKVQGAFLEGVPADQISREAYAKVYNISRFFNNPTDAMDSLKYAIDLALAADEANTRSLSEIRSGKTHNNESIKTSMNNISNPEGKNNKAIKVVWGKNKNLVRSAS